MQALNHVALTLGAEVTTAPVPVLHIQKVTSISGSENHLLSLLPQLRTFGYQPSMLVLVDPQVPMQEFLERMEAAGVPSYAMPMRSDLDPFLLIRLAHFIRHGKFRIVHTHLIHGDVYGTLAASLAGQGKVISSRHNDDAFRYLLPVRLLNRWLIRRSERVICISENLRRFVNTVEWTPATKIEMIQYGLTVDSVPPNANWRASMGWTDDTPVIGVVGRLTAQKGHDVLLNAVPLIMQHVPDVQVVFIGDGELRDKLEEQARHLGVRHCTHFVGYRSDAAALMPNFNLLAHPSRWEGFGLVLLEAMAAGTPIVASRTGAIPEVVIDGVTGLLSEPEDAAMLAENIIALLCDPGRASAMGQAGHERLRHQFTVDAMVRRTATVYDQILQRYATC